jgi:predicted outer membrane repeat protein
MMRREADAMWNRSDLRRLQRRRTLLGVTIMSAVVVAACGDSQSAGGNDAGPLRDARGDGRGDAQSSDGGPGDANQGADGPREAAFVDVFRPPSMQTTCTVPIQTADSSTPTTVVGDGTAASCTEQALSAAVAKGGVVTFNCAGATIMVTQPIKFPIDKDTVIEGGMKRIAIDGGGTTRIFEFKSPNYRVTKTVVTLQNMDILHGKATGTALAMAPAPCSQGFAIDGGGAGIYVRDGVLHVINVTFTDNHAAALGPDVGGGAIYAEGSLDVTVVGSTFTNNSGSNGGAIGSLNSDLTLYNDSFTMNQATGMGANQIDPTCKADGGQSGNGGNFGAVGMDGGSDGKATICGCTFDNNSAGALGGALGRTADATMQTVSIDQTEFDSNTSVKGGGAMYIHNCNLDITASTISNNSAPGGGGIQADSTQINFVNDTFAGNMATTGIGAALALFSKGGTIQSSTFGDNHADHAPGGFAAAIAGDQTLTINDTIFWKNLSLSECVAPMQCQDGMSTGQADLQWPDHHIACTMTADTPCAGAAGTMFADANLSLINFFGGPTKTMPPQTGSPAIGAGKACPATDQRGVPRKPDGCTVGAVEIP